MLLPKKASSKIMRILQVNNIWVYLRTDNILLQYTLHQFQYFKTTCLCRVEIYQQMFQTNSFNGYNLMVLFNWGWSRLVSKLSLMRTLNLLASEARISKWLMQLCSSRWSDPADCLTLLRWFPGKVDIPICSAAPVKKWWYVLT